MPNASSCRFPRIRQREGYGSNLGAAITKALGRIEQANPARLAGIFGNAVWGTKDPDANLIDVIELLNGLTLNPDEVSNDALGYTQCILAAGLR